MENITFEKFMHVVKGYIKNEEDLAMISDAYFLASYLHRDTKRDSGEPYIIHPLNVAYTCACIFADVDTLCAALLHDTLEDTSFQKRELAARFNDTVADLVDGVSKLKTKKISEKEKIKYTNIRKLMLGLVNDPRIIILKLADNLHNMRTIHYKRVEKQIENSLETLNIYVPMADMIGASIYLKELSNRAFLFSDRVNALATCQLRYVLEKSISEVINSFISKIHAILLDCNIPNQIKFRIKNDYHLFQKMQQGYFLSDITDLYAVKIIVPYISNCYEVFDILHKHYSCILDKECDYIAHPKDNLYQSLHTLIPFENNFIQVQIKTEQMSLVADYGFASYWKLYKKNAKDKMSLDLQERVFYQTLCDMGYFYHDNKEFVLQAQKELFGDKVVVYTPCGEKVFLPIGSTAVDFAYRIHSDFLKNMIGVQVNGEDVSVDTVLKNHDTVKIVTLDRPHSSILLEEHAVTTSAKREIRKLVRKLK